MHRSGRWAGLCLFYCLITVALAVVTTTTVSVTSTVTDYRGACNNFYGACVVYGTYSGAPYTTTVYIYSPSTTASSTTWVTARTTVLTTTTVSNGAACRDFTGACVVYGGSASATTVYRPASSHTSIGNGQGYIGPNHNDGGDGIVNQARWSYRLFLGITGVFLVALAIGF